MLYLIQIKLTINEIIFIIFLGGINMNDKFKDIKKPNIDNKTGFEVGSQEYNEYYFPKTEGKQR